MAFFKSGKGRNWQIIVSSSFASFELIFSTGAGEAITSTTSVSAILGGELTVKKEDGSRVWIRDISCYKISLLASSLLKLHSSSFLMRSVLIYVGIQLMSYQFKTDVQEFTTRHLCGSLWTQLVCAALGGVWSSAEQATDRTLWTDSLVWAKRANAGTRPINRKVIRNIKGNMF